MSRSADPRKKLASQRGAKRTGSIGSILPGDQDEIARDIQRLWWAIHRLRAPVAVVGGGGSVTWEDVGSGAAGAATVVLQTYSIAGLLAVRLGTLPWDPVLPGTLSLVQVAVGGPPTGSALVVRVMKNGLTYATVTVAVGQQEVTVVPTPAAFLASDRFTIDITSVGSTTPGADLVVQFKGAYS